MNVYANCANCRKSLWAEATIYRAAERDSPPFATPPPVPKCRSGPCGQKFFQQQDLLILCLVIHPILQLIPFLLLKRAFVLASPGQPVRIKFPCRLCNSELSTELMFSKPHLAG